LLGGKPSGGVFTKSKRKPDMMSLTFHIKESFTIKQTNNRRRMVGSNA
jgi:hypothetical protein